MLAGINLPVGVWVVCCTFRVERIRTGCRQHLTCIHVATVIATKSAPASSAASNVAASSTTAHVGRRGHFVVHGASHSETWVVLLREERRVTQLWLLSLASKVKTNLSRGCQEL